MTDILYDLRSGVLLLQLLASLTSSNIQIEDGKFRYQHDFFQNCTIKSAESVDDQYLGLLFYVAVCRVYCLF